MQREMILKIDIQLDRLKRYSTLLNRFIVILQTTLSHSMKVIMRHLTIAITQPHCKKNGIKNSFYDSLLLVNALAWHSKQSNKTLKHSHKTTTKW